MSVSITYTRVNSVTADPNIPFQVQDTVTAATGIPLELFVFNVADATFSHVAAVYDIITYPTSQAAAQAASQSYYRLASVTKSWASIQDALDFASMLDSRLQQTANDYNENATLFSGTTTKTITGL